VKTLKTGLFSCLKLIYGFLISALLVKNQALFGCTQIHFNFVFLWASLDGFMIKIKRLEKKGNVESRKG
jgi:hypothetical protein